jgi:FkbM family methyltransferase
MQSDGRWRGFNFGISDSDGVARLNTYDRRDFNSVLNLRDADARNYELDLSKKGFEDIKLRTIDSIWDEMVQDVKDPSVFLKTDTQGHDLAVIRGAQPWLTKIFGFQCEVPAIEIYDGMTSMPDMLKFLGSLGYVPTAFDAVNRPDAYEGAAPEFDVTFMKSPSR